MPTGETWPQITIVTPSYDQGEFIEETIRSILLQGYPHLEYIVIDGASTDSTVNVIRKYEKWIRFWTSEEDRGQAHAINKGLAIARGSIFNWINSDDLLAPDALQAVAIGMRTASLFAGACVNFDEDGLEETIQSVGLTPTCLIRGDKGSGYHQPGVWWRRQLIGECGGLDEDFHYVFDLDLAIRYLSLYRDVSYSRRVVARFRLHSTAKTSAAAERFGEERLRVFRKLLADSRFKSVWRTCEVRLKQYRWWAELDRLCQEGRDSRMRRAMKIVVAACSEPTIRCSRLTAGAIRNVLSTAS